MTPCDGVELVLADLDGVVYQGPRAIPHAVSALEAVRATHKVGYVTNNASRTAESVADHLRSFGLVVEASDVVTSPHAAVALLAEQVPAGSTVLVVGGDGLTSVLEAHGFVVTRSATDDPAAVVQGFHPSVGWEHLAEAAFALNAASGGRPAESGIPWIATNTDWTIPVERGTAPGNGTLVGAVHTAVGRLPLVAGKPETAIFRTALERFGVSDAVVVGDRLDTDIRGARRAGLASVLVLTGIDRAKAVLAAGADDRPDVILDDLRGLLEPVAPVEERERRGVTEVRCGRAVVTRDGHRIRLVSADDSPARTLRAACHAVWTADRAIFALDVDPRLYSGS